MLRTEFTILNTEELAEYALLRDNPTSLEIELAQRLQLAMDKIERQRTMILDLEEVA